MGKVEDKAKEFLKKLASHTTLYKGTIDELEVYEPDDVIWAYKEGYRQAEKDLELSWRDINNIKLITDQVECDYVEIDKKLYTKDFYGEILKRFKDYKERKEK